MLVDKLGAHYEVVGTKCKTFVRTTGGKGLHVVVPITRGSTWGEVESFGRSVADGMVATSPRHYVAPMSKAKRRADICRLISVTSVDRLLFDARKVSRNRGDATEVGRIDADA